MRVRITLICVWPPCSKPFDVFPSQITRGVKYCSRACGHLGTGPARSRRVTLICAYPPCSKPFEAALSTTQRGSTTRCCSRTCHGKVMGMRRFPGAFAEKFWAQVARGGPDDCWPWLGRIAPNGYGMLYVPETQSDTGTHVIAWSFAHGRWPYPGMNICHTCDNPPCCNESHLWEGTTQDNSIDAVLKGRRPAGERHHMSKITDTQWQEILTLLAEGTLSRRQIADSYHITHRAIYSRLKRLQSKKSAKS